MKFYDRKFPQDLKIYLSELKRYNGNLELIGYDVNRRFKFISTTNELPPK